MLRRAGVLIHCLRVEMAPKVDPTEIKVCGKSRDTGGSLADVRRWLKGHGHGDVEGKQGMP